jgi:cytoskeletal protein RodZ
MPPPQPRKSKTALIIALIAGAFVVLIAIVIVVALVVLRPSNQQTEGAATPSGQEEQITPKDTPENEETTTPEKPATTDDRLDTYDGELYYSTSLPLSFVLPAGWTAEETEEVLHVTNASGNGTVSLYGISGVGFQTIVNDKTELIEAAVSDAGCSTYEVNKEENAVYYGTTWHEINVSANTSEGEFVYLLVGVGDDNNGGTLIYSLALHFGLENSLPAEELLTGLNILHSLMLERQF